MGCGEFDRHADFDRVIKMKPANTKARALLAKLTALAERGVNGERAAAQKKLDRLKSRFDFSAPDPNGPDLFAGVFRKSPYAMPVCVVPDRDAASAIKWALESACGIPCRFKGDEIYAEATPATAKQLGTIARTIAESFSTLWQTFKGEREIAIADRQCFFMGLYDGMMNEQRAIGSRLPADAVPQNKKRMKKNAIGFAPGLTIHPYTVAVNLGRKVRFSVPIMEVNNELAEQIKKQLEQPQEAAAE